MMRRLIVLLFVCATLDVLAAETVEALTGKIVLTMAKYDVVPVQVSSSGVSQQIWVNSGLSTVPQYDKAGKLRGHSDEIVPGKAGIVVRIYGPHGRDTQKLWADIDRKGRFERVFDAGNGKIIGVVVLYGPDAPEALLNQLKDLKKAQTKQPIKN